MHRQFRRKTSLTSDCNLNVALVTILPSSTIQVSYVLSIMQTVGDSSIQRITIHHDATCMQTQKATMSCFAGECSTTFQCFLVASHSKAVSALQWAWQSRQTAYYVLRYHAATQTCSPSCAALLTASWQACLLTYFTQAFRACHFNCMLCACRSRVVLCEGHEH